MIQIQDWIKIKILSPKFWTFLFLPICLLFCTLQFYYYYLCAAKAQSGPVVCYVLCSVRILLHHPNHCALHTTAIQPYSVQYHRWTSPTIGWDNPKSRPPRDASTAGQSANKDLFVTIRMEVPTIAFSPKTAVVKIKQDLVLFGLMKAIMLKLLDKAGNTRLPD